MAVSSAAGAAGIQPLPTVNYSGPNAGIYLQKQNEAELAYQQALADLTQKKNTAYHTYGLDSSGAVDPFNQYGRYQSLLSNQENDLRATDEAAQQRGLGASGLAMQGERALRYQQGGDNLAMQQEIADISNAYSQGSQQALLARNQNILDAQLQAAAMGGANTSSGTAPAPVGPHPAGNPPPNTAPPPGTTPTGTPGPGGQLPTGLPAGAANVWDVNSPSTYWAINAAQTGGGGVVITPDADPQAADKYKAAVGAGVPVSIAVNVGANETPASLAAKVAAVKQQYPGASITLDMEQPDVVRGGQGSTGWNWNQQAADAVFAAAGDTPISVTTEGVSDFNYGAWNRNGTTFAPQSYNGDMSPRDVQSIVDMLVAQGIDPSVIFPLIAPGQDLGTYAGKYGIYGVPTSIGAGTLNTASGTPAKPLTQTQLNQLVNTSGISAPSTAIQQAYAQALVAPSTPIQTLAQKLVYGRSRPGME